MPVGLAQQQAPPKEKKSGKGQGDRGKGQGGKGRGNKGKGKAKRTFEGPTGSGGYRLNVKNLAPQLSTADAIQAAFSQFGEVVDSGVKTNDDGTSKGIGYVILANEAQAMAAMNAMNGMEIAGKALRISPAQRRDDLEEGGKGGGKAKGGGGAPAMGGLPGMAGMGGIPVMPGLGSMPSMGGIAGMMPGTAPGMSGVLPGMLGGLPGGLPGMPGLYGESGGASDTQLLAMYQMQMQQMQQQQMMQQMMLQQQAMNPSSGMPMGNPLGDPLLNPLLAGGNPYLAAMGGMGGLPMPATAPESTEGTYQGTLKSVNDANGYGFIACPELFAIHNTDVYVSQEVLPPGAKPRDKLRFTIQLNAKGQVRATTCARI
jgi:hypothetical protein